MGLNLLSGTRLIFSLGLNFNNRFARTSVNRRELIVDYNSQQTCVGHVLALFSTQTTSIMHETAWYIIKFYYNSMLTPLHHFNTISVVFTKYIYIHYLRCTRHRHTLHAHGLKTKKIFARSFPPCRYSIYILHT